MSFSFLALILVIFKTNYFLTNETMIFNSGSYQRMAIIWGGKIYYVFQKFYKSALLTWGWGGSVVKNHPANAGNTGSNPGLGNLPGEGNASPLQYSCVENPMDKAAWWATVHSVTKSRSWLKWLNNTKKCSFKVMKSYS